MRCRFCYFEDEFYLPAGQTLMLRWLRPLAQAAVCGHCSTQVLFRGRWLLGPKLPVGSPRPPEVNEAEAGPSAAVPVAVPDSPARPWWDRRTHRVTSQSHPRMPTRTLAAQQDERSHEAPTEEFASGPSNRRAIG